MMRQFKEFTIHEESSEPYDMEISKAISLL